MTTARERPILFSGPMVRAILDGKKSQTRRVVKAEHHYIGGSGDNHEDPALWGFGDIDGCWHVLDQSKPAWTGSGVPHESYAIACPYGVVGDRLWVRETWRPTESAGSTGDDSVRVTYAADLETVRFESGIVAPGWAMPRAALLGGFVPSIHMPRWASRITLEVTGVSVARLKSITEGDAIAEGVDPYECPSGPARPCARSAFAELWDRINGQKAPWASNSWVWKISFRRVEK